MIIIVFRKQYIIPNDIPKCKTFQWQKKIHIIGTCHIDFNGPDNLYKLIEELQPDMVAVEGLKIMRIVRQNGIIMKY